MRIITLLVSEITISHSQTSIVRTYTQTSAATSTSTTTMATMATTTAQGGCPIGYLQRNTSECVDEDECDSYTNCSAFMC